MKIKCTYMKFYARLMSTILTAMTVIIPIVHELENYSPLDNVESSSVIKLLAPELGSEIFFVYCKHSPKTF